MAPTPIFLCGAECGMASTGVAPPAGTIAHWTSMLGLTAVTSGPTPMRSARCWRLQGTGIAAANIGHTLASAVASPATVVARFYIYFAVLPPTNDGFIFQPSGSGSTAGVWYQVSDSSIYARANTTNASTGFAVQTGVWYCIDVKTVHNSTVTCDMQVNGVAQAQASAAGSAGTVTTVTWRTAGTGVDDIYLDDMLVSGTSSDYPLGPGKCFGLYPVSDGAHNFSTAGDFVYEAAGGNVATSATDTWTHLSNPLTTTVGNFMNDAAGATSEYLCWVLDNLPNVSRVNGVASVSCHHAASATANAQDLIIVDDSGTSGTTVATEIAVLGSWGASVFNTGVDLSETTVVIVYECAASGTTTGAWTAANVNDLAVIWGATDVNPDAYIDGVCLEVDVVLPALPFLPPNRRALRSLIVR